MSASTAKPPRKRYERASGHIKKNKESFTHPYVRRLLGDIISETERTIMVRTSLALPIAALSRYVKADERVLGKIKTSFDEACSFLSTLDVSSDQDLAYIKYQVNIWFQKATNELDPAISSKTKHCPLPPSKSIIDIPRKWLFGGIVKQLLLRTIARARAHSSSAMGILASFLMSKRGWPELCQQARYDAVTEHQQYLTAVPQPVNPLLLDTVRDTVRKVNYPPSSFPKLSPSYHASFQSSRKKGGAFAVVSSGEFKIDKLSLSSKPSLRDFTDSLSRWKSRTFEGCHLSMYADDLKESIHSARLQVIPEAGKFRIITAGDAWLYTYLQGIQGQDLSQWAQTPYSTMTPEWEDQVSSWVNRPGWVWNSGDYKAATDQLNISSTNAAIDETMKVFDTAVYTGTSRDSTIIRYPVKELDPKLLASGQLKTEIRQTNGQLMGHPLSFAILCKINLSGLIFALDYCLLNRVKSEDGSILISDSDRAFVLSHTKINGDDILFPSPPEFVPIWERTASELGLKMSIGKSYSSPNFAMVNNVMFMMTSNGGSRIGYLNQKLILNHSLKTGEAAHSPFEIGHALNTMFETFPISLDFLSDAIKRRRETPLLGFQPNFFIPCSLGGFGVNPKFNNKDKVVSSRRQRQVAALLSEDQISSFLFQQGKKIRGPLHKLLSQLPEPVSLGHPQLENYLDRVGLSTSLPYLTPKDAILANFDTSVQKVASSNYRRWVGTITSVLPSDETQSRRIDFGKVKVSPMKIEKIMSWRSLALYPLLPPPEVTYSARYPRFRNAPFHRRSAQAIRGFEDQHLESLDVSKRLHLWDLYQGVGNSSNRQRLLTELNLARTLGEPSWEEYFNLFDSINNGSSWEEVEEWEYK